jgi:hypothetical protein
MSMIGYLRQITPEQLQWIRHKPDGVMPILGIDLESSFEEDFEEDDDELDEFSLNLEKSWDVLHYLLTVNASTTTAPLGNAVLGGKAIGPDVGYGPARYLDAEQVQEIAGALSNVSWDAIVDRVDLKAMIDANVYCSGHEDDLAYARHHFEGLVTFYADAALRGNAMLLYLS